MNFEKFREKWANVSYNLSICRFVVAILAVLVVYLLAQTIKQARYEKIILLPPQVKSRVIVTNDDASPEYIKEMADYIVYLATNYTPQTVEARLREFMKYVAPEVYSKVQAQIKKVAEDAKFYGKSQAFYPKKFEIDKKNYKVIIHGRLIKFYMGKLASDEEVSYALGYQIRNGEFQVTSFYPVENKRGKE